MNLTKIQPSKSGWDLLAMASSVIKTNLVKTKIEFDTLKSFHERFYFRENNDAMFEGIFI